MKVRYARNSREPARCGEQKAVLSVDELRAGALQLMLIDFIQYLRQFLLISERDQRNIEAKQLNLVQQRRGFVACTRRERSKDASAEECVDPLLAFVRWICLGAG